MFAHYFRVFDSLNYVDNLKFGIDSVRKAGGVAEATLCYTGGLRGAGPAEDRLRVARGVAEATLCHTGGLRGVGPAEDRLRVARGVARPLCATL